MSSGRLGAVHRLLSCVRFDEVLVLQGSPLLGVIFSIGRPTADKAAAVAVLVAGSVCLVAHVFVLNDWSGIGADSRDPNRATGVFTAKGVSRSEIGYLSIVLLLISLLLLGVLGWVTLAVAVGIASASALYSVPGFHLKGVPFANATVHFIGGMLHFLLGYSLFSSVDSRGLAIGCFFALTFVAGYLTHEARDHDADRLNGITTNAVLLGQRRSFLAGLILFTISYAILFALAVHGVVPRALIIAPLLYLLHLYWSLRTLRKGLDFASIRQLQLRYRALYAAIGAIMVTTGLLG